uniref:Flavin-containing monooxygenase n=1 Tax=Kalanchoe fedtschenkoi TaxID=63787 RepID=A0A7N0VCH7_KALFE
MALEIDHRQTQSRDAKIAIIGAGVSGIAAAKQLSTHNPVVFEASDSIGGVWRSCAYRSTKLQSPRTDYEFSDFPWHDRDNASFPSNIEILDYLESYAKHFDLIKYVRFNCKVVELRFLGQSSEKKGEYGQLLTGKPMWEVAVQTIDSTNIERHTFEFVVMCLGKYGDIPKLPEFPINRGPEVFKGQVLHSLDYSKLDHHASTQLLQGKKVAVIGYKKSAIDMAVECAEANQGADGQPCTMVIRTLHWTVPHYQVWGLPFFLFYSTRISQFLHRRPNQGRLRTAFSPLMSPMRRGVSKIIESYLRWKLPYEKHGLAPDHPFEEDYASCQMAILPDNFFEEADKGMIRFKKASKWWFTEDGIEFDDNTKLEADVVLLATGYDGKKKVKDVLPEPFRCLVDPPTGVMPLYRGTIHPLIPNMAFVGYLESVSNLHTAELRSIWLSRLADNMFKLPSVEKMLEQTAKELEVSKSSTRFYKRYCISTYSINHSDEICEEMGWKAWRKSSWLEEAFSPYTSRDYEDNN